VVTTPAALGHLFLRLLALLGRQHLGRRDHPLRDQGGHLVVQPRRLLAQTLDLRCVDRGCGQRREHLLAHGLMLLAQSLDLRPQAVPRRANLRALRRRRVDVIEDLLDAPPVHADIDRPVRATGPRVIQRFRAHRGRGDRAARHDRAGEDE